MLDQNGAGKERDHVFGNGPQKPCWRSVPPLALFCAGRRWRGGCCAGWGKVNRGRCACFCAAARMFRTAALFAAAHCRRPVRQWYNDTIYIYREKGLFQPYDRLQTSADAEIQAVPESASGIFRYYQRNTRPFPWGWASRILSRRAHSESEPPLCWKGIQNIRRIPDCQRCAKRLGAILPSALLCTTTRGR